MKHSKIEVSDTLVLFTDLQAGIGRIGRRFLATDSTTGHRDSL
jgi:hypothetical protein